jgi:two-component system phosphate regulon sensor histidine kinase PhoR
MQGGHTQQIDRIRRSLSLVKPIVTLSVGVVLPVLLSTAVGIVAIVAGESSLTLIFGILVVCFTAAAIGGAVILYVLLGRRARLARLQSDLLANVTHELRTPLAAIRVHAQTLQSGLLAAEPERAAESLRTIVRETEWLDAMIDRVLSWRAAARDRDSWRLEVGPLRPVVEGAVARFLRMVPPDEATVRCAVGSECLVRRDPHGLEMAILNLLVNAYKYSSPPRLIGVEVLESGGRVEIRVSDNGIGIPARELRRIFEPFHRVPGATAGVAGAGLGLAIVHHVVKAHDGEITVQSQEGEGSRFSISLPLSPPPGERA